MSKKIAVGISGTSASPTTSTAPPKRAPINTPFKQQVLPAYQPVMTPSYIIGAFFIVAAAFIALGVIITVASDGIQKYELRYDHLQKCRWSDRFYKPNFACDPLDVTFAVTKTIPAPSFLYYQLTNVHQNNRRFLLSVSYAQLSGYASSATERTACAPFSAPITSNVVGVTTVNNTPLSLVDMSAAEYVPCGLRAWSMFNDTFALYRQDAASSSGWSIVCDGSGFSATGLPTNPVNVGNCAKAGITFEFEPGVRYKAPATSLSTLTYAGWPSACADAASRNPRSNASVYACNGWYLGEPGHAVPNILDLDFINWMRPSSLSQFKRLYRRITVDLLPGLYKFRIAQKWDATSIAATKSIVLMNTAWIGGPNLFLGLLFLVAGGCSLVTGAAFLMKHVVNPPRLAGLHT